MSRHRAAKLFTLVAFATLLAACGGAGAGTTAGLPVAAGASQPRTHRRHLANVTFTIVIPANHPRRRHPRGMRPAYLTPAVQGVQITVSQPSGQYFGNVYYSLTPQASYCTGNGTTVALTCTLALQAPPGSDLFTVNTSDDPYYGGYIISTGTLTQKILLDQANTADITTEGVVSHVQLALGNQDPPTGVSASIPISIEALDVDNYVIVGDFDQPLVLSDSDTTGITALSATSLASSSDFAGLNLSYSGAALPSAKIQVEAQSPASLTNGGPFTASETLYPGQSGIVEAPALLHFTSPTAQSQSVTISGVGATAPFSLSTGEDANDDPACGGLVKVGGTSPNFTVKPQNAGSGVCWLAVSDSGGLSGSLPVSVSSGVIP